MSAPELYVPFESVHDVDPVVIKNDPDGLQGQVQDSCCELGPEQGAPPPEGGGLLHDLYCVFFPPKLSRGQEHDPSGPQSDHPPLVPHEPVLHACGEAGHADPPLDGA